MSSVVLTQSGVTLRDLEMGLGNALKEITITMFNCNSEILPPDHVEEFVPGFLPLSVSAGRYPDLSPFTFLLRAPVRWQRVYWA